MLYGKFNNFFNSIMLLNIFLLNRLKFCKMTLYFLSDPIERNPGSLVQQVFDAEHLIKKINLENERTRFKIIFVV